MTQPVDVITGGMQGPAGPGALSALAISTFPIGSAVITSGSGFSQTKIDVASRANLANAATFAGVALADGGPNVTINMIVTGILPRSVVDLGAGVADRVGTNAAGALVRSSDPTCTSGPKCVGFVDTTGQVVVMPHNVDAPSNASWTQSDWYVDWVQGDDANPGTMLAPVKTVMGGVLAKWGTERPELAQKTTIHIVSAQPQNAEKIFLGPRLLGVNLVIVGEPPVTRTVTAGTVTAKNRASDGAALKVAGMTGATTGQLLHNRTHESWAFVDSVVGDTATVSQPMTAMVEGVDSFYLGSGVPTAPVPVNTWAPGDAIDVYDLPTINLVDFQLDGPQADPNFITAPCLWIDMLHIVDPSGSVATSIFCPEVEGAYANVQRCWIDSYVFAYTPGEYSSNLVNCYIGGGGEGSSIMIIGGIIDGSVGFQLYGSNYVDGDVIVHSWLAIFGLLYCGTCQLADSGSEMILHPGTETEIRQNVLAETGVVWGPGRLLLQADATVVRRLPTSSFATCLKVANIQFPSQATTATAYAGAGSWIDGVAITSANLDLYHGLQDVRAGARICEDL